MKVIEALKKHRTLSFEFFPPKTKEQEENLYSVIKQLKIFSPDFVSVTYGALGTTREKSFFWAKEIKEKFGLEPVAHLTCVAATKNHMREQLTELKTIGIENILALRGDPPEGQAEFIPPPDGFRYAQELIRFIKETNSDFCIGAAGYPEKHKEAISFEEDTRHLKEKIDAGAEFIITQLFFDNRYFFEFLERCKNANISVPIIAGIMPITNYKQIKKMTEVCGATIPKKLLTNLEKYQNEPKVIRELGIEQTVNQCQELLAAKIPGLHFFVLNQAEPISQILKEIL
ncbi:MAG: methylenetetrahydrofolate reductase [NAD(P)H] [Candidatus Margulisiibacteriota bacterium]